MDIVEPNHTLPAELTACQECYPPVPTPLPRLRILRAGVIDPLEEAVCNLSVDVSE